MFEHFSKEAKRAVNAAVEEAESRGDSYVGTEHLLIGVVASAAPGTDLIGTSVETLREAWAAIDQAALAATGVEAAREPAPQPSAGPSPLHRRGQASTRRHSP